MPASMHQDPPHFHLSGLRGTLGLRGSTRILVACLQDTVMPTRHLKILPLLIALVVILAACGQSGALYLPEPQQPDSPEQQDR